MKDEDKSKEELINELRDLRKNKNLRNKYLNIK